MALDTHRHKRARTARLACTIGLTGALVMSGATQALTLFPHPRVRRVLRDARELNRLQGQLSSASSTYSEATSNAAETQRTGCRNRGRGPPHRAGPAPRAPTTRGGRSE